jgi:ASC-1-like (ASCH) protein
MVNSPFMTKKKFSEMVEKEVRYRRMTYMDAIIFVCEENKIEVEDARKYVTPIIKSKLETEAMDLNFIPKKNTLF